MKNWSKMGVTTLVPGLYLAVSQGIDGITWFFAWWYKFRTAKSYDDNYWVDMFESGCDLLSHGTLKFAVSHEWIN